MSFYVDSAFFVACAVLCAGGIVLGVRERPLKAYGLAASCIMLVLLFWGDPLAMAYLVGFVVLSCVLSRLCLRWFTPAEAAGGEAEAGKRPAAGAAGAADAAAPAGGPVHAAPAARAAGPEPHAVAKFRVALALQVAPLAVYKVSVAAGAGLLGFLGISYITFRAAQVLIEIRDGLVRDCPLPDYLAFLLFFAPFTSGPITRSRDFAADLARPRPRDEYLQLVYVGARHFIVGALYKFVGSALCTWALWFVPAAVGPGAAAELAECLLYGLNLFFDFAGYSLMAAGVGACLGVNVPRNFNAPFAATDMKDFWNRWHMSLSFWLRDYVFMRVSRFLVRRKVFKSRTTVACAAYMANFVLMGAWHGLTVDYLVYGVYEGLALCACEVWQKTKFHKAHRKSRAYLACSWAVTMVIVFVGLALFSGQVGRLAGW